MSTIQTINNNEDGLSIRTKINTNFSNLNADKAEDSTVVHNTGNETIAGVKTFSSAPVVPDSSFSIAKTTGLQTALDATNPDFYQYSIVRTVASGNLTVAIKNYEGNDPTPTKPVKIMIGGVVRTITGALSTNFNAGTNNLNLGSSELATKEVDLFLYIGFDTTSGFIKMLWSRIPYALTKADFTWSFTSEKGIGGDVGTYVSTDTVQNIGRFNAILSAGPGYTWSIPATSVIVNRPIYETRWLSFTSINSGSLTFTGISWEASFYKVLGNMVHVSLIGNGTTGGTAGIVLNMSSPFASINKAKNGAGIYDGGGLRSGTMEINGSNIGFVKGNDTNWGLGILRYIEGQIMFPI